MCITLADAHVPCMHTLHACADLCARMNKEERMSCMRLHCIRIRASQVAMARALAQASKTTEAEGLLMDTFMKCVSALGPNSPMTHCTMQAWWALVYTAQGKMADAAYFLTVCLRLGVDVSCLGRTPFTS